MRVSNGREKPGKPGYRAAPPPLADPPRTNNISMQATANNTNKKSKKTEKRPWNLSSPAVPPPQ